jgi:dihydroceramide fatty acyl 2-hydroxylase
MLQMDPSATRVRLFRSDQLEKLTLISPKTFAIAWAFFLPAIGLAGWGSAAPVTAALYVAGGLLGWTVFEYAMHRYLFHLKLKPKFAQWIIFLIHGNHHEGPNDPMRNLMPLSVSVPVGGLLWLGLYAAMGTPSAWVILGFMAGYVLYDTIHFACHQWPMRGKFGSMMKRHHMRHHYVDEGGNFSISAIFWDRLFRTHIKSVRRIPQNH